MGAVPKHKISTHRKGKRRKQLKLKAKQTIVCGKCSQFTLPHQACIHCGAPYKSA